MTRLHTIERVLVANRGEIACRIIRTCRTVGVETVAVYSDADAAAPHVGQADDAVRLPGNTAAETYLRGGLLIDIARRTGCTAIHPGYGFLSENADFAYAVEQSGLVYIGPTPSAIAAMGSKIEAKRLMRAAGVPVLADSTVEGVEGVGLPALVKASAGGGGRGMRIVRDAAALDEALAAAEREALANFGDGTVFVEQYLDHARHVEIQVFADTHGNTVSLFERDCTLQRRHQKIIEESPSPAVDDALRSAMGAAAVAAAQAVGYRGAGTVEFLLDRNGTFAFLEMNTRLQVEHPVTELVTGLDLVAMQLLVADGQPLPAAALHPTSSGHAIEARLCAEDPGHDYAPSLGPIHELTWPAVTGVRIDSGVETGSVISPYYDSMIAKVVGWGPTRRAAARRVALALRTMRLVGPITNRWQLVDLLDRLDDIDDDVHTTWLDHHPSTGPEHPARLVAAAALASLPGPPEVLPGVPAGWRNNPSQPTIVVVGGHQVAINRGRDGTSVAVDGIEVDDLPRADDVVLIDGTALFPSGHRPLEITPRFISPQDAVGAGSTVAPMPGVVVRLLVADGESVAAGDSLLTIEAMKMEHRVVAAIDGIVEAILVAPGEQVAAGQVVIRLGAV